MQPTHDAHSVYHINSFDISTTGQQCVMNLSIYLKPVFSPKYPFKVAVDCFLGW